MRIRCHIFGCCLRQDALECFRCGAELYDPSFIEKTNVVIHTWWHIKLTTTALLRDLRDLRAKFHCKECGKLLVFKSINGFCSRKCKDTYIPF